MGMARLLASCRAKMICMGLGDEIALPLKKKMGSCAVAAEFPSHRRSAEIQRGRYFQALIDR
jgi:hypothetical protein